MSQPAENVPNVTVPVAVAHAALTESRTQMRALANLSNDASLRMSHRMIRFGVVGVTCYLIQLGLLPAFQLVSHHLYLAEVIAFLVSAQANFALSFLLTWGDRRGAGQLGWRWLKFNANALMSVTLVNAGVFWALVQVGFRFWLAMLLANAVSACCTFAVNHFFVFKRERAQQLTIIGEK